jgi:hypothetical protein
MLSPSAGEATREPAVLAAAAVARESFVSPALRPRQELSAAARTMATPSGRGPRRTILMDRRVLPASIQRMSTLLERVGATIGRPD